MTIPDPLEIEVFRAGDYGAKGVFGEPELETLAADYNAEQHEAPVTLDHNQDGPADGWVRKLCRIGDRLIATIGSLSPRLRELLAAGAYKKRSVELYRRFRGTGRPYLKAVSFLGAAPPEVKGLADPVFAEPATVTFDETPETAPALEEGRIHAGRAGAATAARARLLAENRWNPAWEELGLLDVFTELGAGGPLEILVRVLLRENPPVHFGEASLRQGGMDDDRLDGFIGTPSPESVRHHRKALEWLATHPSSSYAEALLHGTGK